MGKQKMTPLARSIFVAVLCFIPFSTHADGTYLLQRCQAAVAFSKAPEKFNRKAEMAYCLGLLQGVRETNRMYEDKDKKNAYFCLEGKHLGHTETAQLVVSYLESHPERLFQNESVLTVQALRQAFPCK
ncbi:Rap1a/Tai family immunity protein [Motiliproteus sp. MSK22-1]|uniref:Rap1a/Tai family immunity protein n=1 Tax=Motiliproteus sp. MSK22-1 TaxID=1897630 RepID=UPI0009754CEA|nr:Rap1a/Tai family immunity protein [Motiliproteus sp. MSK22-1]OMH38819.1 hypothetical protein BGP75_00105 [Motiliproteus sp. MSK22-1]